MIKKIIRKIKEAIFGKKIVCKQTNCPYKIESPATSKESIPSSKEIKDEPATEIYSESVLECEHCKKELEGKESAKDENGAYYIWCMRCNYVNKILNGKVIKKENNIEEVKKAFELFKENGNTPSYYSYTENGGKNSF